MGRNRWKKTLWVALGLAWPCLAGAQGYEKYYSEEGLVGLKSPQGQNIIPPRFDDLGWSIDTLTQPVNNCVGYRQNDSWGLVSLANDKITQASFLNLYPAPKHGFVASKQVTHFRGNAFGVINAKGETTLPFRYFSLQPHHDYLIASQWIEDRLQYGLLHADQGSVLPLTYRRIATLDDTLLSVTNFHGKTALYHLKQRAWLTSFIFDQVKAFEGDFARIFVEGKMGLLNRDGEIVIVPQFQDIQFVAQDSAVLIPYPTWWVMTQTRDTLHRFEADTVIPIAKHSYQVAAGNSDMLWNDSTGVFFLPGYERQLYPFENGVALFTLDGWRGAINAYGSTLVPPKYDTLYHEAGYLFAARRFRDSLAWDIYDDAGKIVNEEGPYEGVMPLRGKLFPVRQYQKWGFLNLRGELQVPCIYDAIPQPFTYGHSVVTFHGLQGLIDTVGNWVRIPEPQAKLSIVSPSLYQLKKGRLTELRYFTDHRVFLRSTGKLETRPDGILLEEENAIGLKNWNGEWVIPPRYDSISPPIGDLFYAYLQGSNYGILTLDGQPAMDNTEGFESLFPVASGFFPVIISGRYGFVDELGRLRIANRYDSAVAFQEERAAIKLRGRWGAIDPLERLKVQPLYDVPFSFLGSMAVVRKEGQYGIIGIQGETLLPFEFEAIYPSPTGRYIVQRDGKFGLVGSDGYQLLMPRYSSVEEIDVDQLIVSRRQQFGLMSPSGRDLLPLIYQQVVYDPVNQVFLAKQKNKPIYRRIPKK